MLTRRHLFRTLSAIALAPLAKWLPKEPVASFDGGFPDECVTYTRCPLFVCTDSAIYAWEQVPSGPKWVKCEAELETSDGNVTFKLKPVPQEEA